MLASQSNERGQNQSLLLQEVPGEDICFEMLGQILKLSKRALGTPSEKNGIKWEYFPN